MNEERRENEGKEFCKHLDNEESALKTKRKFHFNPTEKNVGNAPATTSGAAVKSSLNDLCPKGLSFFRFSPNQEKVGISACHGRVEDLVREIRLCWSFGRVREPKPHVCNWL